MVRWKREGKKGRKERRKRNMRWQKGMIRRKRERK